MNIAPKRIPTVRIELLTAAAFEPFGQVIAHASEERRHFFPEVLDHQPEAGQPSFWVSRIDVTATLPLTVGVMERHPFTAQTFLPLQAGRYLVVVAGSDARGAPDPATLRAFRAEAHQGVTYRRNVWHAGLTILEGPAEFAVLMHRTGRGDDDVFLDLSLPFSVAPGDGSPTG